MKIKGGWSYEDRKRWIIFCEISRKQVWKELSCMPSLFIRTVIVVVAANNETGSYRGKAYTPLSAVSQKILVTQIINRMENLTRIPRPLSMARDRFALFAATRSAVKRCHVYVCVCVCIRLFHVILYRENGYIVDHPPEGTVHRSSSSWHWLIFKNILMDRDKRWCLKLEYRNR